jgi:5-methyltetrahydrofolate--homocysteine methyltransferase
METILESDTQRVIIGPRRPFVMVGERINPSGRKKLAAEMEAGNFQRVRDDARAQVVAGAQVIDVNAGIPLADEPVLLVEAIRAVQETVDVPICIDSSVVAALEAGLRACRGKPLVNSVTGEEERLAAVLPLVAERGAAVIGITNDERGILHEPEDRFEVACRIVERAEAYGIPQGDILIDPLTMPIGAVSSAGVNFLEILRRVREELGVNTICGASNIAFGMPDRPTLTAAFLAMAIGAGLTSAILNPQDETIRNIVLATDVLMDRDEYAMNWIQARAPMSLT